eukprot:TRINITY_DN27106_c0_g1_i2.p1 TRINITY_DN27106_c0_g1~~TRINITY_DN27106_c0_g1_i2.p1  ORF type:complete len:1034 (-),score=81.19 TRINITY_DN27106_c0_g1_i2:376-3477(-)
MFDMTMLVLVLLASIRVSSIQAACLPGALPARKRVLVDDERMPLGLWVNKWNSAIVASALFRTLAEDVLGYEVVFSPLGNTSIHGVWAVAGCADKEDCLLNDSRKEPTRRYHVALEIWQHVVDEHDKWRQMRPKVAPVRIEGMGYSVMETTFISKSISSAGRAAGLDLTSYRSYNASAQPPLSFFSRVHDVDAELLAPCNSSSTRRALADLGYVNKYATSFPNDIDGYFQDASGKYWPSCFDGSWWLSPACRRSPSTCIPWITYSGYKATIHMQRAALYNMPLAIGFTDNSTAYELIVARYRVLVLWWLPDATFVDQMELVSFPVHEHRTFHEKAGARGHFPMIADKYLVNGFEEREAWQLLKRFKIEPDDMDDMLERIQAGKDAETAVCEWLTHVGDATWKAWIPQPTDCVEGQGLADEDGHPVRNVENASQCVWCARGSVSEWDLQAPGYVCILCAAGKFSAIQQNGKSRCQDCEPGRFSHEAGKGRCEYCVRGRYSSDPGSSSCGSCPAGFITEDVATADVSECVCERGLYLSSGSNGSALCSSCGWLHATSIVGARSAHDCKVDMGQLRQAGLLVLVLACTCVILAMAALFRRYKRVLQDQSMHKALKQGFRSTLIPQHPMCLMPFLCFSTLSESELASCYEGARDRGALLVLDTAQDIERFHDSGRKVLFFSYSWTSWEKHGPNMMQLACMKAAAKEIRDANNIDSEHLYIWLDVLGIPQASNACKALAVNCLYVYASNADYLVVICPEGVHEQTDEVVGVHTYKSRTWCRIEQFAHFSSRGLGSMWWSTQPGELVAIDEHWLRDVVHIFDGEVTCCRLAHPCKGACDQLLLVPTVLAMYTVLLRRTLVGAPSDIQAIWDMMNVDRARTFPKTFLYNDSGKMRRRTLFGSAVDRIGEFSASGNASLLVATGQRQRKEALGGRQRSVTSLDWKDVMGSLVSTKVRRQRSREIVGELLEAIGEEGRRASLHGPAYDRYRDFFTKTQLERSCSCLGVGPALDDLELELCWEEELCVSSSVKRESSPSLAAI